MRNLKVIMICVVTLFFGVAITSFLSLSYHNQAFATLANNEDISDTIKKSCPSYQSNDDNNMNIKGLVTDILAACLHQDSQSPPTTPNPDTTNFPENIFQFNANLFNEDLVNIVISDTTSHFSNTYQLRPENSQVQDEFTIPVGDTYTITVTDALTGDRYPVDFVSDNCRTVSQPNICTGTMGTGQQSATLYIPDFPS